MTFDMPTGPSDRLIRRMVFSQRNPVVGPLLRQWLKWKGIDVPPRTIVNAAGLQLLHGGKVTVHTACTIGPNVVLMQNTTLGRADIWQDVEQPGGVHVEAGAIIGAGAVVLFSGSTPVRVGAGAIIGANSVVTKDVPAGQVWAGNPARFIRHRIS